MNLIKSIFILALLFLNTSVAQPLKYPVTKKVNQIDTYFAVQVADPYRWLENDTSQEVGDWVQAQNKVTFSYLEKIPFRQQIKDQLTKLWNYPKYSAPFREGKNYFFYKNDGIQNQHVLYVQKSLDSEPEVFLDPNKFSEDGTIALAGISFSSDGKYCAYNISRSGSDWREIYVIDVETRQKLEDKIEWVKFSSASWYKNGFYYSRYETPIDTSKALTTKNEFQKVYYHTLRTKQYQDVLIYEDLDHPLRFHDIGVTEDERFILLFSSESGSKGNTLYFRDMQNQQKDFTAIATTFDDKFYAIDNVNDYLIIITDRDAPNSKVIMIDTKNPEEKNWKEVIPEKPEVLSSISSVGGKLFVTYMKDVTPHVYVYNIDGQLENEVQLPILGMASGFGGKKEDTFVFFSITSFTTPATIFRYDIPTRQITLFRKPEIDFPSDNYITKQVFYYSKDGTRIPMFITHRKDIKLDGTNPTLLYGYGGFNANMTPNFGVGRLIWLEQGGVYAVANLRGGSEYGENWHQDGTKLKKQNVFDDFIAAAEYLVNEKYTDPQRLAIQSTSNGGLLIGAVINQRPELFKVALPAVGVMDMLRFHKFTIGWAWIEDYGSSDDSVNFRNLYAYSPLHNIRANINYPAVLVTTADHDDRVVPAHSFKYISAIQEKYKGENPTLIRIETKAGHGGGKPTTKIIEESADVYSFLFYNLGVYPKY
ncbi:MAG: S9 family peptidase [Ignavibacteriales bacterium]|nr:S9 family peptidase [Ignavibacteriales bacterium]